MRIPLVDLALQHREIADQIAAGFARVMEDTAFILGPQVAEFERAFARFSGVSHCIGVGSGTDALELALRAVDVGPGDEVIVPANTFIASALAIARAGATPVLVDCEPEHQLIDAERVRERIGARTRAIMPVDLFGQIAHMEPLEALAEEAQLLLIEDAAQAHGARRNGRGIGSFGRVAGVSFFPGKNLGAYGDAGAVLTGSDEVAERLRRLRNWGSDRKYHHPDPGFNSRLDTIQAVVLSAKLERLASWNEARRRAAEGYDALLRSEVPAVSLPATLPGNEHVWHLYVVRVPQRDRVLEKLRASGIEAGVHYPVPIHLQGAFAHLGLRRGSFPEAERAADEILSLPIYPGITADQQARVVEVLRDSLLA